MAESSGRSGMAEVRGEHSGRKRELNAHTGGMELIDENGDRICERHDLWLDPTEEGCGDCWIENRLLPAQG